MQQDSPDTPRRMFLETGCSQKGEIVAERVLKPLRSPFLDQPIEKRGVQQTQAWGCELERCTKWYGGHGPDNCMWHSFNCCVAEVYLF